MPEIPFLIYDEDVDLFSLLNIEIVEPEAPAELIVPDDPVLPDEPIAPNPVIITLYDGGMPDEVFEQMLFDVENRTDGNTTVIYVTLHFML